MTEDTASTRDRLVDEVSSAISDAQSTLRRANDATGEKARQLWSDVEGKLLNAKLRLEELQGQALERGRAAAQATDAYVHENPWPLLGAAALVGFAIGVLASRR